MEMGSEVRLPEAEAVRALVVIGEQGVHQRRALS